MPLATSSYTLAILYTLWYIYTITIPAVSGRLFFVPSSTFLLATAIPVPKRPDGPKTLSPSRQLPFSSFFLLGPARPLIARHH